MLVPDFWKIFGQGREAWNRWREENASTIPNLSGVVLEGLEIKGFNFEGCDFRDAKFIKCKIYDCNFSYCSMQRIRIQHSEITDSQFSEANIENCAFNEVVITGSTLDDLKASKSVMHKVCYENCQVRSADMVDCRMNDVIFERSELFLTNFGKSYFHGCHFDEVELVGAKLISAHLSSVTFNMSDMTDVDWSKSFLSNIKFGGSPMESAKFKSTYLLEVDFKDVNLSYANFGMSMIRNVEYSRRTLQKKFRGIMVSNCYGSQRFKTFAQDQDFIEELRGSGKWGEITFWVWWLFADCGRSFLRWAGWSLLFAFTFAAIFFYGLGPASFDLNEKLPVAFTTMIYYSVVTFTTLGFGDITPVTRWAMVAVMGEVILGYIMLGGLISILANKLARRS